MEPTEDAALMKKAVKEMSSHMAPTHCTNQEFEECPDGQKRLPKRKA